MKVLFKRLTKPNAIFKLNEIQKKSVQNVLAKINKGVYDFKDQKCLCGINGDLVLAQTDRYGFNVCTKICKNCGLLRSDPYYSPKSLMDFYTHEYRNIYVGVDGCTDHFFLSQKKIGQKIYNFIGIDYIKQKKTVLEIGCGAGGILKFFQDKGLNVLGCDFDNEYLNFGRKKGLNLIRGSVEEVEANYADIIILNHVIEHISDPVKFLKQLRPVLKKNGIIFIGVPGILNLRTKFYQSNIQRYLQNAHVWHFSLGTLENVANQAGFSLVKGNEDLMSLFQVAENENESTKYGKYFDEIICSLFEVEGEYIAKRQKNKLFHRRIYNAGKANLKNTILSVLKRFKLV